MNDYLYKTLVPFSRATMKTNLLVIDNLYIDPESTRNFALQQRFDLAGNFSGHRSNPFVTDSVKAVIARTLLPHAGAVVDWGEHSNSGGYQLCSKMDKEWGIHGWENIRPNVDNIWNGICFLNPNPPSSSGLAFYKHKTTAETAFSGTWYDWESIEDWEQIEFISNRYNRLVLFRGTLFHNVINHFGSSIDDATLFQIFFMGTEI